jgi:hypothetical protein
MGIKLRKVIAISIFIIVGTVLIGGILSILLIHLGSSSQATQLVDNIIMRENTFISDIQWGAHIKGQEVYTVWENEGNFVDIIPLLHP